MLLSAFFAESLTASKIHPALQEKIDKNQSEYQEIIIRLGDRFDKQKLDQNLSLSSYTRQAAHSLAISALKSHADNTQADLLEFLADEQGKGNVRVFKSYWIDNLIWASIKPELLNKLEQFDDIELIYPEIKVSIIEPVTQASPLSSGQVGVTDDLKVMGADSAWKLGYTGAGTVVASFDTGIEGDHPALLGSYRGTAGFSHEQCWFDPIANDTFPHIFSSIGELTRRAHGTATMGLMVGKDDVNGDTVGVAFDAQWISAGVIDIPNDQFNPQFYLLDAFQWAADPDGDPNTIEDVPDVLSNSWGYRNTALGCSDLFYGVIDNLEALGVVVMFSAGNFGSNYRTLVNPANRATSPYNTFAVGMISDDYENIAVDLTSSRGPSNCNPEIIKPNVVAPGRGITTTGPLAIYPSGIVTNFTGTSFSCPLAAGAALILRQAYPNAPVDSIKKALMLSAADIDEPGPDSTSGYGLVNIPAALEILTPLDEPNIVVQSLEAPFIQPGEYVQFYVTLKNTGLGITGVSGKLRSSNENIMVIDSAAEFGDIAQNGVVDNSADQFEIHVSLLTPEGRHALELYVEDGTGTYAVSLPVYILVGAEQEEQIFTIDVGQYAFTISNYGRYGLGPNSASDQGGVGYVYPVGPSSTNSLFEMGLLIGTDPDHISDGIDNLAHLQEQDFVVTPGGNIDTPVPPVNITQRTRSIFADTNAVNPLGIKIKQETFAYDTEIGGHFMLFIYALENISDSAIENFHVALYADWDLLTAQGAWADMTGFDRETATGYMRAVDGTNYRGLTVLNEESVISYRSVNRSNYSALGISNQEKWQFMSEGFIDTASASAGDYAHMISTGPFTLEAGGVDTAAFAVIAADNESDLLTLYAPNALLAYTNQTPVDTTPPTFTIELLLNPVLPFELDIYAHPSEELRTDPELSITSPTHTKIFSMDSLAGHDLLTYLKDFRITESGSYTITVCGQDISNNNNCEMVEFTAGIIAPANKNIVESFSGTYRIEIPSGAANGEGLLILQESGPDPDELLITDIDPDLQTLCSFDMKAGFRLVNEKARLEIDLDHIDSRGNAPESMVLISIDGNGNRNIPLEYNTVDNIVGAYISDFGRYVLAIEKYAGSKQLPTAFELHQNVPNPFNPETKISFSLPEEVHISLDIFNILGQKVKTLASGRYPAGNHSVIWDGKNLSGENVSTGIYFYRLYTESFTETRRMLLLK
jgi:subtilisin family serine protease